MLLCAGMSRGVETPPPVALIDVFSQDVTRFEKLLSSGIAQERVEGVQGLSHLKYWPAEEALIARLADPSAQVRSAVVSALCRLGTSRSAPHLIRLLGAPDWHTRQMVQLALCRMTAQEFPAEREPWDAWWRGGTPESRQRALLAVAADPGAVAPPGTTRRAALRALVHLADSNAEEPLLRLLQTAQHPPLDQDERRFAVESLERIGTEHAVPALARQRSDAAAWRWDASGDRKPRRHCSNFPSHSPY